MADKSEYLVLELKMAGVVLFMETQVVKQRKNYFKAIGYVSYILLLTNIINFLNNVFGLTDSEFSFLRTSPFMIRRLEVLLPHK